VLFACPVLSFFCADVANLISKTLNVDSTVLTAVLFTQFGLTIGWKTQGTTANELSYTVSCARDTAGLVLLPLRSLTETQHKGCQG
jgi:hypothetical protein